MQVRVTKLVLPVAGLGKRLRPLTLKTPKSLIQVNGKPLLEYALEESRGIGIREAILVVNPAQRRQFETYVRREARKQFPYLAFRIYEQKILGGDGHALLQAYESLRGQPFAVRFCDDIVVNTPPVLRSLIDIFTSRKIPVVLLERVPDELVSRFGVVKVRRFSAGGARVRANGRLHEIVDIVEKPPLSQAPSNLTIVGGYVLTPRVIENLKRIAGVLPLITDDALRIATALEVELIAGGRICGWEFRGKRLDCGTLEKLEKTEEFLKNSGN